MYAYRNYNVPLVTNISFANYILRLKIKIVEFHSNSVV